MISIAGMSGLCGFLPWPLHAAADESKEEEPTIGFESSEFRCGNCPTGGPYYASIEATFERGSKALFDRAKLWENGKEVVVRFINSEKDPNIKRIHDKVREIAVQWCDYANITFRFVDSGKSDVTLNCYPFQDAKGGHFCYGTYNSFIGKDAHKFLKDVPTMNLMFHPRRIQMLGDREIDTDFRRVILHEFGHALGLIHEHQRPAGVEWDEAKLYEYAKTAWGWTRATVQEQIERPLTGDFSGTVFDVNSIMEYPFPRGLGTYLPQVIR